MQRDGGLNFDKIYVSAMKDGLHLDVIDSSFKDALPQWYAVESVVPIAWGTLWFTGLACIAGARRSRFVKM